MKNIVKNLLLSLAAFFFALLAIEGIFRAIETPERYHILESMEGRITRKPILPELFHYDPVFGWSNVPGSTGQYDNKEFSIKVRVNKEGMRYREIGEKKGFRVAMLGDSFTWGFGVEEQDRLTERVERKLGIEILNFGQHGYGPVHYYLQMDKVLEFKPDLIVIGFCIENDFGDSVTNYRYRAYKPYASLKDGKLELLGYPIPNRDELIQEMPYFLTHTAIGRYIYHYYYDYLPSSVWPPLKGIMYVTTGNADLAGFKDMDSWRLRTTVAINEELLRLIKEKADAKGIPLVIMVVPIKPESAKMLRYENRVITTLKAVAKRQHIPVVDDTKSFTMEDYFLEIPHWNAHGHATAAKLLATTVKPYYKASKKKPVKP